MPAVNLQTYRNIDESQICFTCRGGFTRDEEGIGHTAAKASHIFHTGCLQPWWKAHGNCPTCRQELDDSEDRFGGRDIDGRESELFRAWRVRSNPIFRDVIAQRLQHRIQSQGMVLNRDAERSNPYDSMKILNARDFSIVLSLQEGRIDELNQVNVQDLYDIYEALNRKDLRSRGLNVGLYRENLEFLRSVFDSKIHDKSDNK